MSFETLRAKITFYWWIILITILAFGLAFFPWINSTSYQASIGVGISFSNPQFIQTTQNLDSNDRLAFVESMEELSKYLRARFNSVEVQTKIAQLAEIPTEKFDARIAFYNVTQQNGGFVSIDNTFATQDQANKFIVAVQKTYLEIIQKEWNNNQQPAFQIQPKDNFISSINQVSQPKQLQALPLIAGLILGFIISIILPLPVSKKLQLSKQNLDQKNDKNLKKSKEEE